MCQKDGVYILAGVVSFGQSCHHTAEVNYSPPSVYARVSHVTTWIEDTIADNTDVPV